MFFDVLKRIYSYVFSTLYIEIRHKFKKKISSDKLSDTENALFFLSRTPTHHSFTFNLRCLYELTHKARLPKTVCGIFHFRCRFTY